MGEMIDLAALARDCGEGQAYQFFWGAAINIPGGTGFPVNFQAIS